MPMKESKQANYLWFKLTAICLILLLPNHIFTIKHFTYTYKHIMYYILYYTHAHYMLL